MSQVYINISHLCTDSRREDKEYGSWSDEYDFDVLGATLCKPHGHSYSTESYTGPAPLAAGDTIYAIVAVWGSGDSFGHANSGSYDVAIINTDKGTAEANLGILNGATDNDKSPLMLILDDGSRIPYAPGWTGYFESLDSLEIHELTLD